MSGTVATMGDLFARHLARTAGAAPQGEPPPLPRVPPRPRAEPGRRQPIERHPRGEGYELRVAGSRVVTVTPTAAGYVVNNHGASCKATLPDARQADALADRIARLAAMPTGKGDQ